MRRGTLAWRLYALGVVQLGLVALAALVVAIREAPEGPPHDPEHQVAVAAARLAPLLDHPSDIARELDELRAHGMVGSVYDEKGTLVATNVTPPLPRIPPREPGAWRHGRAYEADPRGPPPMGPPPIGSPPSGPSPPPPPPPTGAPSMGPTDRGHDEPGGRPPMPPHEHLFSVALGATTPPPVLVAHFRPPPRDLRGTFFTLGLGLFIVGVGAVLMGRWIVRPLEQLSRAARALGEGDLRARSGLTRGDEVGEVSRTFDEMAERVERLVRAEKELLANVSHELRTPLARIRVALDLAAEGDTDAAREALGEIEKDLAELEALLDDVLTAARMEMSGDKATPAMFALRLEEVAPGELANLAVDRFRSRHPDREVSVLVQPDLPSVRVDRVLSRRVLENLLENAHKYSPDRRHAVVLRADKAGNGVVFDVSDRGAGIPADDVPHVFEPFFRGERSRDRGAGGVGLGLTLAKRIVEAHGGTIALSSVVGEGTTVRVELPAA